MESRAFACRSRKYKKGSRRAISRRTLLDEKCTRSRCSNLAKTSLSVRPLKAAFSAWLTVLQNLSNALQRGDCGSPPGTVGGPNLGVECEIKSVLAINASMIEVLRKRWRKHVDCRDSTFSNLVKEGGSTLVSLLYSFVSSLMLTTKTVGEAVSRWSSQLRQNKVQLDLSC